MSPHEFVESFSTYHRVVGLNLEKLEIFRIEVSGYRWTDKGPYPKA